MSGELREGASDGRAHGAGHVDGLADRRAPEHGRPEDLLVSEAILRRRSAAARIRRRRLLVTDAAIALAIVLVLLIAGIGIGLLGLIALLVLIGFGIALMVGALWRRRGRRRAG